MEKFPHVFSCCITFALWRLICPSNSCLVLLMLFNVDDKHLSLD